MIVTFHIAVYLAYRAWEIFVVPVFFGNDNNGLDPNENSHNVNTSPVNTESETQSGRVNAVSDNEPNLNSRHEPTMSKVDNGEQVKEGDGDLRPSFENAINDEETPLLYSTKPKFECIYTEEKGLRFIPPVYTQRYMIIEGILKEPCWIENIKKVVDFGCAELSFELKHLKKLFTINEIVSVDIDSDLLDYNHCRMTPTTTDYLDPRPSPLTVRVYCGSCAHTNQALVNTDAVIAIELVEHLYPPELDCLPFTVFGFIKPKIAMFTTPNADFNVLFPNFSGFRHLDHKFEWSRQQFEDWGNNIVVRYPDYTVAFQGVGPGPVGTEHLGCCSQMATFVKMYGSQTLTEDEISVQDGPYELIHEYIYPCFIDKRTREEKIRDEAVCFITRCKALSRHYDEEKRKEIPLKNIMERVKCYNREKLKRILINDNWEVTTDAYGYEVVILPDSESEYDDEDSWSKHSEGNGELAQNDCDTKYDNTLTNDEDWGCNKNESSVLMNSPVGDLTEDCQWQVEKIVSGSNCSLVSSNIGSINCAQLETVTNNDPLDASISEKSSVPEALVPDLGVVCDRFKSCQKVAISEKDTNIDYSLYETPLEIGSRVRNSKCKSLNSSDQSVCCNGSDNFSACNRALSFETSDVYRDYDSNNMTFDSGSTNEQTKTNSFCCVSNVSSPSDTSTYATPCCSQLHKKYIPKCLSLQQINPHYASPSINTELENSSSEQTLTSKQKDKMSKSMEGFKTQESCDVHETCSNTSKVIDSGYPDSYSEHIMDMDLTPEQFDDIETESEGNDVSSRSLSPPLPPAPQIPRMIDDVENGDVANNNRDGEGNNMVADMDEEPLEFEAQIEEVNNEIQNLAGADLPDQEFQQFCNKPNVLEQDQESSSRHYCSSPESFIEEKHFSSSLLPQTSCNPEALEATIFSDKDKAILESQEHSSFSPSKNKPTAKGSKSGSSIVTSSSWSHLDSSESQPYFDIQEGVCKTDNNVDSFELKAHNSLTTVLDGCSNISNCSLVRPINKDDSCNESIEAEDPSGSMFGKRVLNIDTATSEHRGSTEGRTATKEDKTSPLLHPPLQQDDVSLPSEYQSTGSLSSSSLDHNVNESAFPEWLLDIQISDSDENELDSRNSIITVWDSDSFDDLVGLNYDVQVDVRGGGDPQRETWH